MEKAKDENDKHREGTLPDDPASGTLPISSVPPVRATTLRLVRNENHQPVDADAEAALLAVLLWNGSFSPGSITVTLVRDVLPDSDLFFVEAHKDIYDAINVLHDNGTPPDPVSVHSVLLQKRKAHKAGGIDYLEELVASATICSDAKLRTFAQTIRTMWLRRKYVALGNDIEAQARTGKATVAELAELSERGIAEIRQLSTVNSNVVSIGQCVQELVPSYKFAIRTGMRDLDEVFPGFMPEEVSVLAARTSVGKSALAMQWSLSIAGTSNGDRKIAVLYATLEMPARSFSLRVESTIARVSTDIVLRGQCTAEQARAILAAKNLVRELPIFFGDKQQQTLLDIRDRASTVSAMLTPKGGKLGLIVVDHIGLVKPSANASRQHREQQVAETSRGLRWLASEFKCHVLGLAQISRESEKRAGADKMPKLHEMRESGALEQDPDNVFILHREFDRYGKPVPDKPAILNVAKTRNLGIRGHNVFLKCEPTFVKFSDWE